MNGLSSPTRPGFAHTYSSRSTGLGLAGSGSPAQSATDVQGVSGTGEAVVESPDVVEEKVVRGPVNVVEAKVVGGLVNVVEVVRRMVGIGPNVVESVLVEPPPAHWSGSNTSRHALGQSTGSTYSHTSPITPAIQAPVPHVTSLQSASTEQGMRRAAVALHAMAASITTMAWAARFRFISIFLKGLNCTCYTTYRVFGQK